MSRQKNSYLTYAKSYIVVMGIFCSALLMNYLFLKRSGEFLDVQQIYEIQTKPGGEIALYGSGLFNSSDKLKLYAYSKLKPKIIALGSSRVLEFRQDFFIEPFYNLGTTVHNIEDAVNTTNMLLELHTPEIIIFGVDFWWFNSKETYFQPFEVRTKNAIDPGHLLKPFIWLKDKKISIRDYFSIQLNRNKRHLGVRGKIDSSGVGPDGSYYKTDMVTTDNPAHNDVGFANTKKMIVNGTNRFVYGKSASDAYIVKFVNLINSLESKGVRVVIFFPPLPIEVNNFMEKYTQEYAYIDDLKEKLAKANLLIYDYTDASKQISTTDCEFVDGYHGGDVLYAKILRHIATKHPILASYTKVAYLDEVAEKYSGLALIPNPAITTKSEVDFLCMGCKKEVH